MDHSQIPAGFGPTTADDPPPPFWRYAESPMAPAFPHFQAHSSSSLRLPRAPGGSFSVAGSREEIGWSLPTRSMSFGQVDELPVNYPNHYHHPSAADFRRRVSSDVYGPPSLDTSNTSSSASISEPQSAPVSGPAPAQARAQFGFPPGWNAFSGPHAGGVVGKGTEGIGGWYSEPSPLAKVQEEDAVSSMSGEPAVFYSTAGHHPG